MSSSQGSYGSLNHLISNYAVRFFWGFFSSSYRSHNFHQIGQSSFSQLKSFSSALSAPLKMETNGQWQKKVLPTIHHTSGWFCDIFDKDTMWDQTLLLHVIFGVLGVGNWCVSTPYEKFGSPEAKRVSQQLHIRLSHVLKMWLGCLWSWCKNMVEVNMWQGSAVVRIMGIVGISHTMQFLSVMLVIKGKS